MTLKEYLEQESMTPAAFGRMLGLKSRASVIRWINGDRTPSRRNMKLIASVTQNKVTPDSFYQ